MGCHTKHKTCGNQLIVQSVETLGPTPIDRFVRHRENNARIEAERTILPRFVRRVKTTENKNLEGTMWTMTNRKPKRLEFANNSLITILTMLIAIPTTTKQRSIDLLSY